MSERNQRKDRVCKFCGEHVFGKASKLKEHGRECKKTHELAAAQAILDKMNKDMLSQDLAPDTLDKMHEEMLKPSVVMADERVLNAEGD